MKTTKLSISFIVLLLFSCSDGQPSKEAEVKEEEPKSYEYYYSLETKSIQSGVNYQLSTFGLKLGEPFSKVSEAVLKGVANGKCTFDYEEGKITTKGSGKQYEFDKISSFSILYDTLMKIESTIYIDDFKSKTKGGKVGDFNSKRDDVIYHIEKENQVKDPVRFGTQEAYVFWLKGTKRIDLHVFEAGFTIVETDMVRERKAQELEKQREAEAQAEHNSIVQKLKAKAQRDWPDDYTTQEYWINEQLEAYEYMKTIDNSDPIKKKAQRDWPLDFSTQKYWYDEQIEARGRLQ